MSMIGSFNPGTITAPYSSTPIKIADVDGTHILTFDQILEPSVMPEFTYSRNIKVTRTRPSANSPGLNVFSSFGSSDNMKELALDLPLIDPTTYTQLKGYSDARPGVFRVSIDGGANWYYCTFKDKGLVPKNYRFNQRAFNGCHLDLYIIRHI